MNAKGKGTAREYRTKRVRDATVYTVFRMMGSHGLFDLIAVGATDLVCVQLTSRDWPSAIEPEQLVVRAGSTPTNRRESPRFPTPKGRIISGNFRPDKTLNVIRIPWERWRPLPEILSLQVDRTSDVEGTPAARRGSGGLRTRSGA